MEASAQSVEVSKGICGHIPPERFEPLEACFWAIVCNEQLTGINYLCSDLNHAIPKATTSFGLCSNHMSLFPHTCLGIANATSLHYTFPDITVPQSGVIEYVQKCQFQIQFLLWDTRQFLTRIRSNMPIVCILQSGHLCNSISCGNHAAVSSAGRANSERCLRSPHLVDTSADSDYTSTSLYLLKASHCRLLVGG